MTYTVTSRRWKLTFMSQMLYQVYSPGVSLSFLVTTSIGRNYIPILAKWKLRLRDAVMFPRWPLAKSRMWDLDSDLSVSSGHATSLTIPAVTTLGSTLSLRLLFEIIRMSSHSVTLEKSLPMLGLSFLIYKIRSANKVNFRPFQPSYSVILIGFSCWSYAVVGLLPQPKEILASATLKTHKPTPKAHLVSGKPKTIICLAEEGMLIWLPWEGAKMVHLFLEEDCLPKSTNTGSFIF